MPPEGSKRAGILLGCPSLDRGSREVEVRFAPRTSGLDYPGKSDLKKVPRVNLKAGLSKESESNSDCKTPAKERKCNFLWTPVKSLISFSTKMAVDPTRPICTQLRECSDRPMLLNSTLSCRLSIVCTNPLTSFRSEDVERFGNATIEKGALSIIFGVNGFRKILYSTNFTPVTEHKPLFGSEKDNLVNTVNRLQRWGTTLLGYKFTMKYV
ncbi:hypothetical protein T265_03444 [Opisthorchis viverrini]|uniref:Reverse transcriptase RNase H-like domain-containing protein n=1 Tax=Opisthorchis viverrini TaxID=6198 RepID=A0A074ZW15_OPIVI|nr:hypothetical protein T265_03444 [Opisthorchis viverrini]KER30077.1 hypothetical protein T265_03444 [Opisthorchis viverrini]